MRRDNAAVERVANGNHEFAVPHLSSDHGGEAPTPLALDPVARTAAANLRPAPSGRRLVASGHPAISPEIAQILSENPPVPKLSPRQTEVLESITRGLSNEDIAHQLGISVARVREHLTTLFEKLGAANRAEAVAIALRKHLLKL